MRNLKRNTQIVFFRNYQGEEEVVDEFGNATGIYVPIYGPVKSARMFVSPNKGNSEVEQFGSFEDYDRTMATADIRCEIDEDSILWLDNGDTQEAHNALVTRRAPWKNSIQYAIKMVKVSYADDQN